MNYQKWLLASTIAAIAAGATLATTALANQSDITGGNPINPSGYNWSFSPSGGGGVTINGFGTTTTQGSGSSGTGGTTGTNGTPIKISGVPQGFNLPSGIIDIITAYTTGTGTGASTNGDTGVATNPDGSPVNPDLETAMGTRRSTDFNIDVDGDPATSSAEGNLPDGDGGENANGNSNCESDLCVDAADEVKLSFNEIAELIESDLDRTVEQLAAAEAAAQQLEDEPRRIARSSSLSEDVCPNPKIAAAKARKTLQDKLDNTKMFIEQMELINPDTNIW